MRYTCSESIGVLIGNRSNMTGGARMHENLLEGNAHDDR